LTKIPSDDIANAILRKVNAMNLDIGIKSFLLTLLLAAGPDLAKLIQ
jgi:hypothetical protein